MNQNAYVLMKFCPWCGHELVYVETGIDDIKSCPKFMSHTISFNREYSKNESYLILNVAVIPTNELI